MNKIIKEIENTKIIPVVTVENITQGLHIMDALAEGGLPAAEITFRTEAAAETIRAMSQKYPDALIGAGTILNVRQAKEAEDAGAKFLVSPGYSDEVVNYCIERNIAVLPGYFESVGSRTFDGQIFSGRACRRAEIIKSAFRAVSKASLYANRRNIKG